MNKQKVFTGIGSRITPIPVINQMVEISTILCSNEWVLRSGGADGADSAFERGCDAVNGVKEIYLPCKGFNGNSSNLYIVTNEALDLAEQYHPHWSALNPFAKRLMARNGYQVLGQELYDPTSFVVYWTPDGVELGKETTKHTGGTGQAIRVASAYNVPVFNLARPSRFEQLLEFINNERYQLLTY